MSQTPDTFAEREAELGVRHTGVSSQHEECRPGADLHLVGIHCCHLPLLSGLCPLRGAKVFPRSGASVLTAGMLGCFRGLECERLRFG